MGFYYSYQYAQEGAHTERVIADSLNDIDVYLKNLLSLAYRESARLKPLLRQANNDPVRVHAVLVKEVDMGQGLLRFGWADNHDRLRAGSVKGVYSNPPSLAHRTYIQQAHASPEKTYIGPVLPHIVTGRQLLILYTGMVSHNNYLGTLIATIDIPNLVEQVRARLQALPVEVVLQAPAGEEILRIGSVTASPITGDYFHIAGRVAPVYTTALAIKYIQAWAVSSLLALLVLAMGYAALCRWLLPVHAAIDILNQLPGETEPAAIDALEALPLRMQVLHDRLARYAHNEQQAHEWQSQMQQVMQHFMQAQKEQASWLNAASLEMEQIFSSISDYAQALEEQALQRRIDPAHRYDFDDVTEAGENLKFIANGFYLISLYKTGHQSVQLQQVDIEPVLTQVITMLMPSIERRNLEIFLSPALRQPVWCDEDMLRHAAWGMMCLAVRYAANEATVRLDIESHAKEAILRIKVSRANREIVMAHTRDLRPFIFPDAGAVQAHLLHALKHHVNMLVAQFFMQACGGSIEVQAGANMEYGMDIVLAPVVAGNIQTQQAIETTA